MVRVRVQVCRKYYGLHAARNAAGRFLRNAIDDDAQSFSLVTEINRGGNSGAAKGDANRAALPADPWGSRVVEIPAPGIADRRVIGSDLGVDIPGGTGCNECQSRQNQNHSY